ncbi:MAG: hypothetical protein SOI44_09100 [Lactimicrobium sp.]|jgi:hypothetical protein|uniref:hypothetical protein n=1 Tax=Lactimicrobium sp. TaxID=2563780 RepID=UPI002F35A521
MDQKSRTRAQLKAKLIHALVKRGYPEEFGSVIADQLGTEMTMERMLSYLHHPVRYSTEEIVDEMLAILDDRDRWQKKHITEYNNSKYNDLLNFGLGNDEEDDE